jgi:hypothetical protein
LVSPSDIAARPRDHLRHEGEARAHLDTIVLWIHPLASD